MALAYFGVQSLFEAMDWKRGMCRRIRAKNYSSLYSDITIFLGHIFIFEYVDMIISLYDDVSLARFLLASFFILSKKIC